MKHTGPWKRVVFADECDEDGNCPNCHIDYSVCSCPGPTQDGFAYRTHKGVLQARKLPPTRRMFGLSRREKAIVRDHKVAAKKYDHTPFSVESGIFADPVQTPEDHLLANDDARSVWRVLAELPERTSTMLLMFFGLDGDDPLTFDEVGERYGLTSSRVSQIIHKGLRVLRWKLRHDFPDKWARGYVAPDLQNRDKYIEWDQWRWYRHAERKAWLEAKREREREAEGFDAAYEAAWTEYWEREQKARDARFIAEAEAYGAQIDQRRAALEPIRQRAAVNREAVADYTAALYQLLNGYGRRPYA